MIFVPSANCSVIAAGGTLSFMRSSHEPSQPFLEIVIAASYFSLSDGLLMISCALKRPDLDPSSRSSLKFLDVSHLRPTCTSSTGQRRGNDMARRLRNPARFPAHLDRRAIGLIGTLRAGSGSRMHYASTLLCHIAYSIMIILVSMGGIYGYRLSKMYRACPEKERRRTP